MAVQVIRQGKSVRLIWRLKVLDETQLPGIYYKPYDPPSPPVITILDPSGVVLVNAAAMTKLPPTPGLSVSGIYSYTFVTPNPGALNAPYTAKVDTVDGSGQPSGSVDSNTPAEALPVFQLI